MKFAEIINRVRTLNDVNVVLDCLLENLRLFLPVGQEGRGEGKVQLEDLSRPAGVAPVTIRYVMDALSEWIITNKSELSMLENTEVPDGRGPEDKPAETATDPTGGGQAPLQSGQPEGTARRRSRKGRTARGRKAAPKKPGTKETK